MVARVLPITSRGGRDLLGKANMWRAALDMWEDFMRAGGLPASTIGLRLYHLTRVARELGGEPWAVTAEQLIAWLAAHPWSPNTRRAYRSSLRGFYRWGVATGRVEISPAEALPPVKLPRAVPRPAPEVAYREALARADPRARCAIMLAGACGLRRGEIAAVRTEDVEPDPGGGWSLRVAGKGGHVRLVPLPDDLAGIIRREPAGWLFRSSHGGHLTPHHLGKIISRELPGDLTTHTLRHRCGTVAYGATRDLRAVQELLGHAKPETTALYTQVPRASIRLAMEGAAAPAPTWRLEAS